MYIFVYNLKDGSRWLQPPRIECGGIRKKGAFSHLIQRLGPIKEVVARRTRQPDYNALFLSLSHRSLTVGLLNSP